MTKTEKRLLELCELIEAYFQMQQPIVRNAIESQVRGQAKIIIDDITTKKLKPKESIQLPITRSSNITGK